MDSTLLIVNPEVPNGQYLGCTRTKFTVQANTLAIAKCTAVPVSGTSGAMGTATPGISFSAASPPSGTIPPSQFASHSVPGFDFRSGPSTLDYLPTTSIPTTTLPTTSLPTTSLATTSGGMFGFGETDETTMSLPQAIFEPYGPTHSFTSNPTAFDPTATPGPSSITAQRSAAVSGKKRKWTTDENGSRKRHVPADNKLAPSGSRVLAANQDAIQQATFAVLPRPQGISDVEYGKMLTAQINCKYGYTGP